MTDPTASLIADLERIALAAGDVILRIYNGVMAVRAKGDQSPVTDADEAAERLILAELAVISPGTPIVAEESAAAGRLPAAADLAGGARFWLVDPLDGTKEFIQRRGEFTVNIALIENGVAVLGIVYAPALGLLYSGARGAGATRRRVTDGRLGTAETIRARTADATALVAVASKSHRTPETDAYLSRLPNLTSRAAGSSLKFCLVAEGNADIYPRFGPTMEWDTAAGHAVLAAAGGAVDTFDGQPLAYGKPGYGNPNFIAYGRWPAGLLSPINP